MKLHLVVLNLVYNMFLKGDRMNKKGFTLIELLAVFVILGIIMVIAIPSINSSMNRTKKKQNVQRIKLLESYAESYVSEHKNSIYQNINEGSSCYISIQTLIDEGYLSVDESKDSDGKVFNGVVVFQRNSSQNIYQYSNTVSGVPCV